MPKIPFISRDQMAKIDDLMVNKYNIQILQMMELAGYHTARMVQQILKDVQKKNIIALVGRGNNGGDAICAARHLHNWGANVSVALSTPRLKNEPLEQLRILKKVKVPHSTNLSTIKQKLKSVHLIIDGLIGYNLKGAPYGKIAKLITLANQTRKPILAIDIPSGLNASTGQAFQPCIKAKYTLTLSLPKTGLKNKTYVGKLYVADMGLPLKLFKDLKLKPISYFKKKAIIKI